MHNLHQSWHEMAADNCHSSWMQGDKKKQHEQLQYNWWIIVIIINSE